MKTKQQAHTHAYTTHPNEEWRKYRMVCVHCGLAVPNRFVPVAQIVAQPKVDK